MGPQCPTANENENLISRHIVAGRIVTSAVKCAVIATSAVKCAAEKNTKNKDPSQKKGRGPTVGPSFVKQAAEKMINEDPSQKKRAVVRR